MTRTIPTAALAEAVASRAATLCPDFPLVLPKSKVSGLPDRRFEPVGDGHPRWFQGDHGSLAVLIDTDADVRLGLIDADGKIVAVYRHIA